MKRYNVLLLVIAVLSQASTGLSESEKGKLVIVLEKVKGSQGKISIALCSSEQQYYEESSIFRAVRIDPQEPITECIVDDIPYGMYAIKVYHDQNGNNELDTGFLGIPRERYGFSNNPKIRGGMPSFEATAFEISSPNVSHKIQMR